MPRFVARPVTIEAHQFSANTLVAMPDAFRRAVLRYLPNGVIEVATGDGPRPCKYHDWIVAGPDGQFSVWKDAAFESMFVPQSPPEPVLEPAQVQIPAARRLKEKIHG